MFRTVAAIAVALAFAAAPVRAAAVLDQTSVPGSGVGFFGFFGTAQLTGAPSFAQAITVGATGRLVQLDLGLQNTSGLAQSVTLHVFSGAGSPPSAASALYTTTFSLGATPKMGLGNNDWSALMTSVALTGPVLEVAAGQQLLLALSGQGSVGWLFSYGSGGVRQGPAYAGGATYGRIGNGWYPSQPATDDYAFRTFVDPAPVPEPGIWALLVAGFGLLGGALRGRRRLAPA